MSVTPERLARAARVEELLAEGKRRDEIADLLGISIGYVSMLIVDPDGSDARRRKQSYRMPCPECGTLMDGSGGRSGTPERCKDCQHARQTGSRKVPREAILEMLREFQRATGRPPTVTDVVARTEAAALAHRLSDLRRAQVAAARHLPLPVPDRVVEEFGSWRAGVEAAGLTPSPLGGAASPEVARVREEREARIMAALRRGATSREVRAFGQTGKHFVWDLAREGVVKRERVGRSYIYRLLDS